MTLTLANGQPFELPTFDPVVARHFENAASNVETLVHQINVEKIYARFFENKQGLTFLDIGANIGLVSIYATPACDRILAVEPAPETFEVLRALTFKHPQIEIVKAALAPHDGKHEFFVNDINSTASSTVNTYGKRIEVPALTLTSLLSIHQLEKVDVCKIDAEGAEGESLSFEQLSAAQSTIKTYFIETHNCPKSTWEEKMGRLVQNFLSLGYRVDVNGMTLIAER